MKLNYKLLSIPFLVIVSLFYISFIFSTQISDLKKQVDGIYFGNYIPVKRLHLISENYKNILIYHQDYDYSKQLILENWNQYKEQYKTTKEKIAVENIDLMINKSFVVMSEEYFKYIIGQIDLLVKHEEYTASLERKEFLIRYKSMNDYLFYNQIFITVSILILLSYILIVFLRKHNNLENLKDKYKIDSITDGLTSIYNRKYFDEIFSEIIEVSKHNGCQSAFVMIDIDFFKQYNDNYGHDDGDTALIKVATTLNNMFSDDYEYVFRIGGEEFAILLFDINIDIVKEKLDKLRNNIQQLEIIHKSSSTGILTLSIGVLMINESNYNNTSKELYKLADDKLYISKQNGRDRYTI